jgi:hypothetical protein
MKNRFPPLPPFSLHQKINNNNNNNNKYIIKNKCLRKKKQLNAFRVREMTVLFTETVLILRNQNKKQLAL